MSQLGCDNCWSSDAAKAWAAVTRIPIEEYLVDESHYIVSIRKCPSCAQRYLQVTTETVDWHDGEDPVHRTILPIDDAERATLTTNGPPDTSVLEAVGAGKRSLEYDWPKGQEKSGTYWGTGLLVGPHD